jgi:hypothetical protein
MSSDDEYAPFLGEETVRALYEPDAAQAVATKQQQFAQNGAAFHALEALAFIAWNLTRDLAEEEIGELSADKLVSVPWWVVHAGAASFERDVGLARELAAEEKRTGKLYTAVDNLIARDLGKRTVIMDALAKYGEIARREARQVEMIKKTTSSK